MVPVFCNSDSPLHEDTTPPRGLQLGLGGELSCLELKVSDSVEQRSLSLL